MTTQEDFLFCIYLCILQCVCLNA